MAAPSTPPEDTMQEQQARPAIPGLDALRTQIDEVDSRLLDLLNQRAHLSLAIGKLKADVPGAKIWDPDREALLLDSLAKRNPGPLGDEQVASVWREILAASRALQKTCTTAAKCEKVPSGQSMIRLHAPASKSVSHRVLIAAALARGESRVLHALSSTDIERTRAILISAGASLEDDGDGCWKVTGMENGPAGGTDSPLGCDAGGSGTTCRLLTAVLAAGRGVFRICGAERMKERPIGALASALASLGARFRFEEKEGCPPFILETDGLAGGDISLGMDESSQYLSGLLLAAPFCSSPLRITLAGKKIVSWPYAGLTLQTLENFGISFLAEEKRSGRWLPADWRTLQHIEPGKLRITVMPGTYRAGTYAVEGDWSGASCLLAAGAAGKKPVLVQGLRTDSAQGDRAILGLLRSMDADIKILPEGIAVFPSALHGITADMGACPDLVPTIAMAAAFAQGTTVISNIAHLRIKECDRISACAQELARIGVRTEEEEGSLTIFGLGPHAPHIPQGTVFSARNDHRIAMSVSLLGLGEGTHAAIDDPGVVRKSFPDFWKVWSLLQ